MPPGTLTRRFSFVEEKIKFSEQTLDAFVRAGLLRLYDPVVALEGLKSALGKKANDSRREEALVWAFRSGVQRVPRLTIYCVTLTYMY